MVITFESMPHFGLSYTTVTMSLTIRDVYPNSNAAKGQVPEKSLTASGYLTMTQSLRVYSPKLPTLELSHKSKSV